MKQKPTRFYITQEEDHTVVRSVPMARRVRTILPAEERETETKIEIRPAQDHPSMSDRIRARFRKPTE